MHGYLCETLFACRSIFKDQNAEESVYIVDDFWVGREITLRLHFFLENES